MDLLLIGESDFYLPEEGSPKPPEESSLLYEYLFSPLRELGLPSLHSRTLGSSRHALAVLGGCARSAGFETAAVDDVFRIEAAADRLFDRLEEKPLVVGITTAFLRRTESVLRLCAAVRRSSPDSLLVLGGYHSERDPAMRAAADLTVAGRGEAALIGILRAARAGLGRDAIVAKLCAGRDGLARGPEHYPEGGGVPEPDWDLPGLARLPFRTVAASHGCRSGCLFCSFPGRGRQQYREPEAVLREVRKGVEGGARSIHFIDANLTSDPGFIAALCEGWTGSRIDVPWSCYGRADDLSRGSDTAAYLAGAGCRMLYAGVESLDDDILRRMRKGTRRTHIEAGLERARAAGLAIHANFIVGFPGETEATALATADAAAGLPLSGVSFSVLRDSAGLSAAARSEPGLLRGYRAEADLRWTHETMSSRTALRLAERALGRVCESSPAAPASFWLGMYHLLGACGLDAFEVREYFEAVRSCHRGGDAAPRAGALQTIRRVSARAAASQPELSSQLPRFEPVPTGASGR